MTRASPGCRLCRRTVACSPMPPTGRATAISTSGFSRFLAVRRYGSPTIQPTTQRQIFRQTAIRWCSDLGGMAAASTSCQHLAGRHVSLLKTDADLASRRTDRASPTGPVNFASPQARAGGASSVYVVALSGGAPVRVLPDFEVANDPVWAPDGRSLLVAGRRERTSQQAESLDWWLAPLDGRPPVKTGVFETPLLRGAGSAPGRWTSSGIFFSFNDDLWRVTLSSAGRLSAPPRRLTLGVGPYVDPATGPSGEVVFARLVTQRAVERASLTNPTEPVMRLYADTGSSTWRASETNDGSIIVFEREVGAAREIWTKNTRSGRQEWSFGCRRGISSMPRCPPMGPGLRIRRTRG